MYRSELPTPTWRYSVGFQLHRKIPHLRDFQLKNIPFLRDAPRSHKRPAVYIGAQGVHWCQLKPKCLFHRRFTPLNPPDILGGNKKIQFPPYGVHTSREIPPDTWFCPLAIGLCDGVPARRRRSL
jgi:hypothetical protein